MGIIEQIMQMKSQGMSDEQLIGTLREQGISPKQINDAISQIQIKNAVSGEENAGMQPSIMEQGMQDETAQMPSEKYSPQIQEMPQYATQNYAPQEGYYEGYSPSSNTDTIIEVAEQVFSEKIQKMVSKLKEVADFKNLAETKMENIGERLKRIENTLDKLQMEILGKVGSYGETLQGIKKEMSMMQDSFGKSLKKSSSIEEKISGKK